MYSKIDDRTAHVVIIGLGYVGLPLAVEFAEAGFRVTGIDLDPERCELVRSGLSYILDVEEGRLARQVEAGRLDATENAAVLENADSVHICVPTPLSKTKDPDVSFIIDATKQVARYFHPGILIVLESTSYPGTTEEILLPQFAEKGHEVGEGFYLAFSPERIDPGNRRFGLRNTPKIIGGITPECGRVAKALYSTIVEEVHLVSSSRAAELVKILENTFRAVNIGLVNEMAIMCDRLGIDTWEVIDAAATKPFGFMPFYPGPGLGGHCIPIDPHYLTWKVRTLDYRARLIEVAAEINAEMPEYVVAKVTNALNDHSKSVRGSRILMLGVAYKRDVDDTRESPLLDIMRLLQLKGAQVEFNDPHVPEIGEREGFELVLRSIGGLPKACSDYDCVIVGTDHSSYDWAGILEAAKLLVDTRNVTRGCSGPGIVRL